MTKETLKQLVKDEHEKACNELKVGNYKGYNYYIGRMIRFSKMMEVAK